MAFESQENSSQKGGGNGPVSLEQVFERAVNQYQNGQLKESENTLLDIQAQEPDIPEVLHLLSVILLQSDRPDEAIEYLEKAVGLIPDSPELFNVLGSALNRVGRLTEALSANEAAVGLDPGNPEAHYNLGNRFKNLERWAEAADCYRYAVDLNPDFLDAHHNLSFVLKKAGLLETAAQYLREAIHDDPKDAEAHCRLGTVLDDLENPEEAENHYRQAIGLNPDFGRAHCYLGSLLMKQGRMEDALVCFSDLLACAPKLAATAFKVDLALNGLGEYLRSQPEGKKNLDALKVFFYSDLEAHCRASKTEYTIPETAKIHQMGSGQPAEGHHLFLAELQDAGVLGGSCLPVTRSGEVFIRQLTHNAKRLTASPTYQQRVSVILGTEKQLAVAADEDLNLSGPHILIGSQSNIGHWLLNYFCRLMIIRDREELKTIPVVVSHDLSETGRHCLSRMGYDEDQIISVFPGQIIWFDKLWVPSIPYFGDPETDLLMWAPEAAHFIRDVLDIPLERDKKKAPRRLFLTRRNAQWRQLLNEDEIFSALEPLGFERIDPGDFSLDQQIDIASQAEIIMGPFGAGMNLHQFAPRDTHVVELKLDLNEMDIHPAIAKEVGQIHHPVICEMENPDDSPLNADLVVPFDELISLAKRLTEKA